MPKFKNNQTHKAPLEFMQWDTQLKFKPWIHGYEKTGISILICRWALCDCLIYWVNDILGTEMAFET